MVDDGGMRDDTSLDQPGLWGLYPASPQPGCSGQSLGMRIVLAIAPPLSGDAFHAHQLTWP
jgi:hypothetical protein